MLAHGVGSGKTYEALTWALEGKRLGLHKKPMLAVHNITVSQYAEAAANLYPGANIYVATKADLESSKRRAFMARVAANDYDVIIVPHSSFNLIPNDPVSEEAYVQELLADLEEQIRQAKDAEGKDAPSVKEMERQKRKLKDRIDAIHHRIAERAEGSMYFEQLGVDALLIDEAHEFKKPPFITKITGVKGLDKQTSQRAASLMLKLRHVRNMPGNRGIRGTVLATGTPVTNTLGEAWHMLNLSSPKLLQDFGVDTFDRFVSAFATVENVLEQNAGGTWKYYSTLSKFKNGLQFAQLINAGWDVLTTDELVDYFKSQGEAFPTLKDGQTIPVTVPKTPQVTAFTDWLKNIFQAWSELTGKQKKEASHIPVLVYMASRAAAMDMRLVRSDAKDEKGSKVNSLIDNAYDIYSKTGDELGVQAIFADSMNRMDLSSLAAFVNGEDVALAVDDSKPSEEEESESGEISAETAFLYADMKRKLAAKGIPESEIALISDYKKEAERKGLFDRVNSGEVRIVIGGTKTLGTGANIQRRLKALHHLDIPWTAADLKQREGRMLRFGNTFKEVEGYSYGMEDTLDSAIFAKILRKARQMDQALSGKLGAAFDDPFSDVVVSAQEMMAHFSGDTRIFELKQAEQDARILKIEQESHDNRIARARERLARSKENKLSDSMQAKKWTEISDTVSLIDPKKIEGTVNGEKFTGDRKALTEKLNTEIDAGMQRILAETKKGHLRSDYKTAFGLMGVGNTSVITAAKGNLNGLELVILGGYNAKMEKAEGGGLKQAFEPILLVRVLTDYQGQKVSLYDGQAKTGAGAVGALEDAHEFAKNALARLQGSEDRYQRDIGELENVIKQKWPEEKKAKLEAAESAVSRLRTELEAAGKAEEDRRKSARQELRRQTDIDEEEGDRPAAYGFFGAGKTERSRSDQIGVPGSVQADNPEVERQLAEAHGVKKDTILQRIKALSQVTWRAITRSQIHVPNDSEHATMNEMFRLAKQISPTAQDEANRNIAAIVDPLGPQQLQLFSRKVVLDNLLDSVDRGEPLRFGFQNRDEVAAYKEKLDRLADTTPEVKEALKRRKKIATELVENLVEQKLLPEEALERADTYYHQQVLQYLSVSRLGKNPQITKKGFQKKRVQGVEEFDESLNYNTSYIEAEFEWMRDAYHQIGKEQWLQDLGSRFDKKAEIQEYAKENDTDWRDIVRQSKELRLWWAKPGNAFYQAIGVAEHVVEDVLAGIEDETTVIRDDLRPGLIVMGGKQREMVLPNELADQLEGMAVKTGGDVFGNAISSVSREAQKLWKTWTLFNPLRAITYNLRNITGDIDPVMGGAIGSLTHVNKAIGELAGYYGVTGKPKLKLSPDLEMARNLGVIDSSLTASEIPDLKDLEIFKRLYAADKQGLPGMVKNYFDTVKRLSSFRESIARYAAFLYYKQALDAGTLNHYGGAKKETVDRLAEQMGTDVAAAHLSRNLLGDYGDLTVGGNFLREHLIPFWSWQEVNLKRYPQMFVNAAMFGPRSSPDNPAQATAYSAAAVGSVALPFIIMALFNRLVWPKEEDELSDDERASPHLILGKNPDGSTIIMRNTGALGDFTEWFGLNTMLSRLDELHAGQMSFADVAREMGVDLINKAWSGMRPDMKALVEVPTGKSTYPNVLSPRSVRRDELVSGYVGLTDVYREIRGRVTGSGARSRPNFLARTVGVVDPRESAFHEIRELSKRYQEKLGGGQYPRNEHFSNMEKAAATGDSTAFREARNSYLSSGKKPGDYEKFRESIGRLDPLTGVAKSNGDRLNFEENYLTPDQRQKLGRARDYARELEVKMSQQWNEARQLDSPQVAAKLREQEAHETVTLSKHVLQERPSGLTAKETEAGKTLVEKQAEWKAQREKAIERLKKHPLGREAIIKAVNRSISDSIKDPSTEYDKKIRFVRALGWLKPLGSKTGPVSDTVSVKP